VGDMVVFSQTRNSDGSYTINSIAVILPKVGGQVTGTTASTITVKGPDGSSVTINVDSSTTYKVNGATGALADIKSGMMLMAEGTKRADGSLDATAVVALNWGGNGGNWKVRGPGRGHAPDNQASPAPSASPGTNG
jgi:hypothetical protein